MVAIHRTKSFSRHFRLKYVIVCLIVAIALFSLVNQDLNYELGFPIETDDFLDENVRAMKRWKRQLESSCQRAIDSIDGNVTSAHLEVKEQLEAQALQRLDIPNITSVQPIVDRAPYKYCKHVFIDLGTNR